MSLDNFSILKGYKGKPQVNARCRKCMKEKSANYYKKNREVCLAKTKKYRQEHPEIYLKSNAEWKDRNKEHMRSYRKKRHAKNMQNNPQYRASRIVRGRINSALKHGSKTGYSLELLGCSITDFMRHLESLFQPEMSWENHGVQKKGELKWQIDHIRPIASFDLTDPEQQKTCFHWSNCQPLWAVDNRNKSDKLI